MNEIIVDKKKLIDILKTNREAHRKVFEEALEGWKIAATKEIERLAAEAKAGKLKNAYLSLPRPDDHTPDYDRAIQMLELDISSTVELDEHEFSQYVQDDWGWKHQWAVANTMYAASLSNSN